MRQVKFLSTTRYVEGGFSVGNYANFNLATHTNDDLIAVENNRQLLLEKYNLPNTPKFLEQTHSTICLDDNDTGCFGDSIITCEKKVVCCVMTADCLPIFAYDKHCNEVGVCHAGWQGLFAGVIENFIQKFNSNKAALIVHFGTALSKKNFEVEVDFYQQFITKNQSFACCFSLCGEKYKFDIYHAATIILNNLGVINITSNSGCTFNDDNLFSYRRDGTQSGRQAHLIWIE